MIFVSHVIKVLDYFIQKIPSRKVTILPSLVSIGTVVVEM